MKLGMLPGKSDEAIITMDTLTTNQNFNNNTGKFNLEKFYKKS